MADIRAIVLDFDGVVVESVELKNRAFGELFRASHPNKVDEIVAFQVAHMGESRYEKFPRIYRDILGEPFPDGEMERLDRRLSELVFEAVATCAFVPGAEELIRGRCTTHALFVASATPQEEVRRLVGRRGLEDCFVEVFGAPLSKAEATRRVLARGLAADEVLFVGDAVNDLEAAQETGVRFVGRVPPGEPSPFPVGTETVADLAEVDGLL